MSTTVYSGHYWYTSCDPHSETLEAEIARHNDTTQDVCVWAMTFPDGELIISQMSAKIAACRINGTWHRFCQEALSMECELRLDGQRSEVHRVTAFCQEDLESAVSKLLYELLNNAKDYSAFTFSCRKS